MFAQTYLSENLGPLWYIKNMTYFTMTCHHQILLIEYLHVLYRPKYLDYQAVITLEFRLAGSNIELCY